MGSLDEERLLSAPASSGEALELGAAQHTWRTGFWACGGDWRTFCLGAWCPCVLFGRNQVEIHGGDDTRFCPECWTFWSIPALISTAVNMYMYQMMLISVAQGAAPPLGALYACSAAGSFCGAGAMAAFAATRRRRLREQEGLPEGRCRDFARYFCCPACAVCQEAAQLEPKKEARLRRQGHYSAVPEMPPPQQRMQH